MDPTDAELLGRLSRDDADAAMAALIARHGGMVYAAARRQVRELAMAADVAQAVFIVLHRKAGRVRAEHLTGWLLSTCRFAANDALKSQRRRAHHERVAASLRPESSPEAHVAEWDDVAPHLDGALARLTERQRSVVALHFLEGQTFARTGIALGVSEDAARVAANRAIERLRVLLKPRNASLTAVALATHLAARGIEAVPSFVMAPGAAGTLAATAIAGGTVQAIARAKTLLFGKAAAAGAVIVMSLIIAGSAVRPIATPATGTASAVMATSSTTSATAPSLSPLAEATIEDWTTGKDVIGFDLDLGKPIHLLTGESGLRQDVVPRNLSPFGPRADASLRDRWIDGTGLDLALHRPSQGINGRWTLATDRLVLAPLPGGATLTSIDEPAIRTTLRAVADHYDYATTRPAGDPLAGSRLEGFGALDIEPTSLPRCFAFRTLDGAIGALELTKVATNGTTATLTFRYRLASDPGQIALPDGSTMKVVGVSRYPSTDTSWWGADGERLPYRPSVKRKFDAVTTNSGHTVYEVAWRHGWAPAAAQSDDGATSSLTFLHGEHCWQPHLPPGSPIEAREQWAIDPLEGDPTVTLRTTMSVGPWTSVGLVVRRNDGQFHPDANPTAVAAVRIEPSDDGRMLKIFVPGERDESIHRRAVITTVDGKTHSAMADYDFSSKSRCYDLFEGEPIGAASIVSIGFEERTEQAFEIRNISLAAGRFTVPSVVHSPADDALIVPGERLGALKLGMSRSDVAAILGTPTTSTGSTETFDASALMIVYGEAGRVVKLIGGDADGTHAATRGRFLMQTRGMIGVDTPLDRVTTTFAGEDEAIARLSGPIVTYCYARNGIEFYWDRSKTVIGVAIFVPE